MARSDFPQPLERTRQASFAVCEKAKLILRRLLPNIEALQNDNTHFSPRLMLLMLSRTGNQLSRSDRDLLQAALQYDEEFQPKLFAWMTAVKEPRNRAGGAEDFERCTRALELLAKHSVDLDGLLTKIADTTHAD